jgi:hypothetical protein
MKKFRPTLCWHADVALQLAKHLLQLVGQSNNAIGSARPGADNTQREKEQHAEVDLSARQVRVGMVGRPAALGTCG